MQKKLRVGILFGGRSAEHEVSIQSAKNVLIALDKEKYEPVLIAIDKSGGWHLADPEALISAPDIKNSNAVEAPKNNGVVLAQGKTRGGQLVSVADSARVASHVDVVFPVLHGPFGEDGAVQGLFKLAGVPFVGAGILGSAVGMDKDVMKRLLRDAGVPIAKFLAFSRTEIPQIRFEDVKSELGLPLFVKPANLGSSVGINKVRNEEDFNHAVQDAFQYDNKILIEEYIEGREIECSVLGSDSPIASLPGEIVPNHDFYTYQAKYLDENGATLEVPAKISQKTITEIQKLSVRAFKVLCLEGMARIDFFLKPSGEVIFNEANTIPGFTKISMYPKLWGVRNETKNLIPAICAEISCSKRTILQPALGFSALAGARLPKLSRRGVLGAIKLRGTLPENGY
ncbi:MAG: D-alanine--D-alanine ligase [Candidatus Sungbacteria bacterium]|uniref:D-alanine--D-alanine ligase n=1 Tax=Candidatus Sungiibacteriota bacterium TaxID=2750080 RepID=A0A931WNX7_9BACT|nr:D-alanine--D-alanine ligase [Candidatus Sungbacteria bacterium]